MLAALEPPVQCLVCCLQASMSEQAAPSACSSNITVTTADIAAADVVPGYSLEGMVGEGGFCQVGCCIGRSGKIRRRRPALVADLALQACPAHGSMPG